MYIIHSNNLLTLLGRLSLTLLFFWPKAHDHPFIKPKNLCEDFASFSSCDNWMSKC